MLRRPRANTDMPASFKSCQNSMCDNNESLSIPDRVKMNLMRSSSVGAVKKSYLTRSISNRRYKNLNDTTTNINAGWMFVDRCKNIMKYKPTTPENFLKRNTGEAYLFSMDTSTIDNKDTESKINDYKQRPRRNAIFELTCEERIGLPLLLKYHIQFKTIQNYGIL